ncbi:hypothetical protein EVAR_25246_1 [Eumeta japonica]|uniref:Uncharacterized protein n=1 Tax=Eumeta variegata TaxID=151549 RepID=A0A4C1WJP5_EUMVA|nr:hypothetical protein EVAR_25246_1 [Eumeta japonica]
MIRETPQNVDVDCCSAPIRPFWCRDAPLSTLVTTSFKPQRSDVTVPSSNFQVTIATRTPTGKGLHGRSVQEAFGVITQLVLAATAGARTASKRKHINRIAIIIIHEVFSLLFRGRHGEAVRARSSAFGSMFISLQQHTTSRARAAAELPVCLCDGRLKLTTFSRTSLKWEHWEKIYAASHTPTRPTSASSTRPPITHTHNVCTRAQRCCRDAPPHAAAVRADAPAAARPRPSCAGTLTCRNLQNSHVRILNAGTSAVPKYRRARTIAHVRSSRWRGAGACHDLVAIAEGGGREQIQPRTSPTATASNTRQQSALYRPSCARRRPPPVERL